MKVTKENIVACSSCIFRKSGVKHEDWFCGWYDEPISSSVSLDGHYSKPKYCNVEWIKIGEM
jgi:hypothetical protein